jgi:hypothetical protein
MLDRCWGEGENEGDVRAVVWDRPGRSGKPPGTTGTGQQQSNDGVTPLIIGGVLLLVVLLVAFYLWRRRGRVRDL